MRFFYSIDWIIFIISLLLLSTSVLVVFSSSKELALQQLIFSIVGFLIFLFISNLNYHSLEPLIKPIFMFVVFLLIVVMILDIETRGATRWIPIGPLNIQPSEFAKPALILLLAGFWSRRAPSWKNIFTSILLTLIPAVFIFRQPDLGTALTIIAIWLGMLLMTKISLKQISVLFLVGLVTIPVVWFALQDYQKSRVFSFISPSSDPLGEGYNIIQSTIAVGSGQFLGRGLGYGTQSHLQFLPEYRTDFIFAAISEEFGFLGSFLIICLYLFILIYLVQIAKNSQDIFGFMIVVGVVSMLLFQSIVNIGMNIGLLPITGITLPLISYGGSSLIATLLSLGLVVSVSKYRLNNKREYF